MRIKRERDKKRKKALIEEEHALIRLYLQCGVMAGYSEYYDKIEEIRKKYDKKIQRIYFK